MDSEEGDQETTRGDELTINRTPTGVCDEFHGAIESALSNNGLVVDAEEQAEPAVQGAEGAQDVCSQDLCGTRGEIWAWRYEH